MSRGAKAKLKSNGNTISKNLTFRPVVIAKAKEILSRTGEEFAVMAARLINEKYDEMFPCTCRRGAVEPTKQVAVLKQKQIGN